MRVDDRMNIGALAITFQVDTNLGRRFQIAALAEGRRDFFARQIDDDQ